MGLQSVLRVIFPPACISCGGPVASDFGLCAACWQQTPFIGGLVCDKCGVPLPGEDEGRSEFCDDCMTIARPWDRGRAAFLYKDKGRDLVLSLKHADRLDLIRPAAEWLLRAAKPILQTGMIVTPTDGRTYSAIGSIQANNETSFTYQYTDNDPLNGLSYYRLRIVEDNVISYSHILVVNLSEKQPGMTIYPVPASSALTIRIKNSDLVNTEAQLLSSDGRLLQKIKLHGLQQNIHVGHLPAGVYYLKTVNGKAYKIVKQ